MQKERKNMETKNNVADAGKPGQTASAQGSKPAQTAETPKVEAPKTETKPADQFAGLDDVLSTSKSRKSGGTKIRPGVGYTLIADNFKNMAGKAIPEQQQVILKILRAALTSPAARVVNGVPVISEVELNKLVLAAHESGALKTKQDAWHIFRYYRTSLSKQVKDGGFAVLKEVEIPLAA